MTLDMTKGKPFTLMARFALPFMLSTMLQQLYSVFDSVIVGRMLGAEAFAAVSASASLNWFPLSMISGVTQGFGVLMAQRFGSGDARTFRRSLCSSITMSLACGLLLTIVGVCFLRPFLALIKTPAELTERSVEYLRVLWSGLALTALYNVASAALSAMGDSRTPLIALVIATAANIALDYVFLAALGMGVEGAALATLISQALAIAFCALRLFGLSFARPKREDWKPDAATVKALLRLGLPLLVSRAVTSTGSLSVQTAINSFGVVFVTGVMASYRYFSLLSIVGNALEAALATFAAQNYGAGSRDRVISGTRTAALMGAATALVISAAVILLARPLIRLFLPYGENEAVTVGIASLRVEALFLIPLNLLCLYRTAIQGTGNSFIPMLSGFLELAIRLVAAVYMPARFGREGLYYTDAITWTGTAIFLVGYYYAVTRKKLRTGM